MLKSLTWLGIALLYITGTTTAQVPIESFPFWTNSNDGNYSTGMIWRDCNGDGLTDVFFSNGNDIVRARNTVFLSYGGSLLSSPSWQSSNLAFSGHCAVGDINDDGFPDFAVANFLGDGGFSTANLANLYINQGGLPSSIPDWYGGDSVYSFSCCLGDFDADGDLDLALATGEPYGGVSQQDLIYYNSGSNLEVNSGWQSAIATIAMDVTCGDLDRDGYLDLVFCYDDLGVAAHYNNAGSMATTLGWQCNSPEPANTVVLGDVNGDGWLDVVVAFNSQLGGGGKFKAYFNDGTGGINPNPDWQSSTGGYGSAVSLYDYDNDGDLDLAAGRWWDAPRVYENLGAGFTSTPVWQAGLSTVVEELAWIDVDGDGVESLADTIPQSGVSRLFYTTRGPLQAIDSVVVDGSVLPEQEFCYDLISGWVSLASPPSSEIAVYYQYSLKNDLTVANWDTYNSAFGNTNRPRVDFHADPQIGWVPLTVQFTDSSIGATDHHWRFGDGSSADVPDPSHTFESQGAFDVYLENVQADGWHNNTRRRMIIALADTLEFSNSFGLASDTVKVPIFLNNSQPLPSFVIPVDYSGSLALEYARLDTDSCRTDYFDNVEIVSHDPYLKVLAVAFTANVLGGNLPLSLGSGRVVNLYFKTSLTVGTGPIDTTSSLPDTLLCDAVYAAYQPAVVPGSVNVRRCGDIDGDYAGPNVADLTFLVEYIFQEGPPPDPEIVANVDGESGVNIADITYLVDYFFAGGPSPRCK